MASTERIWNETILKITDKLMAGVTSLDYQEAVDMIETTNIQTANRDTTFRSGRIKRTISIEGIHHPDQAPTMTDFWALDALVTSGAETAIYFGDTASPGSYIELNGLINNLGYKAQDNGTVNITASFQITGAKTVTELT